MVGKLEDEISFWGGLFSGAMLVSGSVTGWVYTNTFLFVSRYGIFSVAIFLDRGKDILCHMCFFLGSSGFFPRWCTMRLWKFDMSTTAVEFSTAPDFQLLSLVMCHPMIPQFLRPFPFFCGESSQEKGDELVEESSLHLTIQIRNIIPFIQMSWLRCVFLKDFNTSAIKQHQ